MLAKTIIDENLLLSLMTNVLQVNINPHVGMEHMLKL